MHGKKDPAETPAVTEERTARVADFELTPIGSSIRFSTSTSSNQSLLPVVSNHVSSFRQMCFSSILTDARVSVQTPSGQVKISPSSRTLSPQSTYDFAEGALKTGPGQFCANSSVCSI